ncbi:MAG: glycosyl transferase group 1 [Actinomycetia bacterium]|nr:glycosyl transferase group 1 [Actinomycetes bacterium]
MLVVATGPLDARPFLLQAAATVVTAGWETSIASPTRAAVADAAWYPLAGGTRASAKRLRRLAAQTDLILTDPGGLRVVQRAQLRAPVVLLVEEELLGTSTKSLRDGRIDLAIATSEAAAGPVRWLGIETVVLMPPIEAPLDGTPYKAADVIGCATRFHSAAGLDVLLDAFAELADRDVRLEVVNIDGGDDKHVVAALRARAARPDLDGRVQIFERAQDHLSLMRHWRVAVTANVGADSATAPLRDAVALGVPVVATDRGANAEVVGATGVLVRPGRADELARALEHALDDHTLRERAVEEAVRRVDHGESARRHNGELIRALSDVAERGVRRRAGTVVFVVPDFEPTLGGTTRQTHNQASELRARGYDVLVLTQRLELHWPRSELRNGLRLQRVGPSGRTFLRMKLLVLSMSRWLRQHRDDIAVVNVIMYPDFVVSAALAGLADRTVMCWAGLGDATDTVGTSGPLRAPLRAIRRRALSSAAQVALTPALREELDRLHLGRDVTVIPTPVNVDEFRPATPEERRAARRAIGVTDDELVIAYTGHLRALKRVERLVEAFERLVASGRPARLVLVGSSRDDLVDSPTALREQLGRVEVRDRIIITGAVADVRPYLHAADAFVLPSDREGLSNSVLEALASGVPVVAPPSAAGDQVLDETCGIIPESNNPSHLYAALISLADDPEYRARLAVGARRAAERFALGRVVNEYEGLYSRLRWRAAVR